MFAQALYICDSHFVLVTRPDLHVCTRCIFSIIIMASGGFQELAEDLECPICMGEMDKPKVLQCKHVFCAGCLQKWLHGNKLICPVCRYEQNCGGKSIDDLPKPLIISRLQEKITKFLSANIDTGPLSRNCDYCEGKASHFCSKCSENLCDRCTQGHSSDKMTRTHKITQITRGTVCPNHPSRFKTGYCDLCKLGICGICKKIDHSDHDVIDIEDEDLLREKTLELQNYQKQRNMFKHSTDFNKYKDGLNQFMKVLKQTCYKAEQRLEKLRNEMNIVIDELKTGLRQHLAAEEKKMAIHKAELDDIRATRESLLTFIEDVLQRNSSPDIVMAADELPDISVNTELLPRTCKQPEISDYDIIIQSVKDLVKYKKYVSSAVSAPTKHATSESRLKPNVTAMISLSPTTTIAKPTVIMPYPSFVTVAPMPVVHHDPKPSSTLRAGSGARSKTLPDSLRSKTIALSSKPSAFMAYTHVWEANPGGKAYDVVWDELDGAWWMRTASGLYKYDMDGSQVDRLGQGGLDKVRMYLYRHQTWVIASPLIMAVR